MAMMEWNDIGLLLSFPLILSDDPFESAGYVSDNVERPGIDLVTDRSSRKRNVIYCQDDMLIRYIYS